MQSKFKVKWLDMLSPEYWNYYYGGFNPEKVLLTYQWLISKVPVKADGYGHEFALLSGEPTLHGLRHVKPLTGSWTDELEYRFRVIILSKLVSKSTAKWRESIGIDVHSSRMVMMPYSNIGDIFSMGKQITKLLSRKSSERKKVWLRDSHNPYHPDARLVVNVKLNLLPELDISVNYGNDDKCSSSWTVTPTCTQKKGELIPAFFNRAEEYCDAHFINKEVT